MDSSDSTVTMHLFMAVETAMLLTYRLYLVVIYSALRPTFECSVDLSLIIQVRFERSTNDRISNNVRQFIKICRNIEMRYMIN